MGSALCSNRVESKPIFPACQDHPLVESARTRWSRRRLTNQLHLLPPPGAWTWRTYVPETNLAWVTKLSQYQKADYEGLVCSCFNLSVLLRHQVRCCVVRWGVNGSQGRWEGTRSYKAIHPQAKMHQNQDRTREDLSMVLHGEAFIQYAPEVGGRALTEPGQLDLWGWEDALPFTGNL